MTSEPLKSKLGPAPDVNCVKSPAFILGVVVEPARDADGAMTLGTDIPIVSEAQSRAMKPDYYLVLPWHFKEEFLQRERDILARGTSLIFPLPSIEIISGASVSP